MRDFQLTKSNQHLFFDEIQKELDEHPVLVVSVQSATIGKWGMARLWRAWMATTADFMAKNGCTMPLMVQRNYSQTGLVKDLVKRLESIVGINNIQITYGTRKFNCDDAHELFTRQHLGVDKYGKRLSWSKKGHNGMRAATKGERYNAMMKHSEWCSERGIVLFNPIDSEYKKLEQKQNE